MNLQSYFDRIGFAGPAKADLDTFRRVHGGHANSLTYENLDVQLRVPVSRDAAAAYEKIVNRRRGGWCYEMNGLLGWALEEIGFDVTRLAGAAMRDVAGDEVIGNHLVLLVRLDGEPWIGDVGFGDGLIEPALLREGPTLGNPLSCNFREVDGGWWRYENDPRSGGPSFDFNVEVTDERLLEDRSRFLQSAPISPFVQNAVAQRWNDGVHYSLRGRVLRSLSYGGDEKTLIASSEDYVATLRDRFALDVPQAGNLWPAICRRHDEIFGARNPLA